MAFAFAPECSEIESGCFQPTWKQKEWRSPPEYWTTSAGTLTGRFTDLYRRRLVAIPLSSAVIKTVTSLCLLVSENCSSKIKTSTMRVVMLLLSSSTLADVGPGPDPASPVFLQPVHPAHPQ